MKEVIILKRCQFIPLGSERRVPARPGQRVVVSAKDAEKMVAGNVAVLTEKPELKKAPVNRQKKVLSVK